MFSVIIPLYNKAHTIEGTLFTVLNQTFTEFEVIIVDDGSTDNSLQVVKDFSNDSRLRFVSQQNMGVSAARNRGAESACHDYLAFIDGDDEWKPDYLKKIHEAIIKFPDAGMYCCAGIVTAKDYFVTRIAKKYTGKILEINFFENPHIFLHTSAVVVLKSQFFNAGGFPIAMKRNEDYALFFCIALVTKVVYCGIPLSVYSGNVLGQATTTPMKDVLGHVVNRFNLVYERYRAVQSKNPLFEIFTKYELRHMFLINLRDKNIESNRFLVTNLSTSLLSIFKPAEIEMYLHPFFQSFGIAYILLTKLRWRMRGYPYIGQR